MQIGWREFIKSRFSKASKFHSVGIEIGVDECHVSTLQKIKGQINWVKQDSLPIENWQTSLKTYVQNNNLTNTQCNVAFSISKYQLLQLDRPAVEDAELNQALQWAVKEQLFSDDELAIDYFDTPAASNLTKLNVVAISKREVIEVRNGVLKAGLALNIIGVEELATCNLIAPSDDAIIILKQEEGGQLSLNIIKQNELYFSRRLRGYENLANFSPEELKMGVVDNLSLEIQRSMDYFESQLRQAPVKKVYISLDTIHQDVLADSIKEVIFVSVEKFIPNVPQNTNKPIAPSSLAGLGAAINNASLIA
ncbi:MSHA biogenesis protein MshI [uncultured Paraglaciecola sp.]|uniref:type IV pilus biogenesis protein PilM n=1 Tax=uncultured Paraglaciecola sp. TaxID=1765024 RepID=UPI0030DC6091|tara:strand:- start:47642 stop:48565 length:924 start_codon:yes stop_codon:yes gene_type:complete